MTTELAQWIAEAAEQFNEQAGRTDGQRVAKWLTAGLSTLRDALYRRIHEDVERAVGKDSMLMPASELKAQQLTYEATEFYLMAESALAVGEAGYFGPLPEWYLPWLARLRLGPWGLETQAAEAAQKYLPLSPDRRRLGFMNVLGRVLPESRRTPLVLFQLLPLCVRVVTACAFGDWPGAERHRQQQVAILPAIADCRQCRGRVLHDLGACAACGNPLWKHEWLVVTD